MCRPWLSAQSTSLVLNFHWTSDRHHAALFFADIFSDDPGASVESSQCESDFLRAPVGGILNRHERVSKQSGYGQLSYADSSISGEKGVVYCAASAFGLLVNLGNMLRAVWFDFFYALGVAWVLPLIALWANRRKRTGLRTVRHS